MTSADNRLIPRARLAAMEPYTDAPASDDEWLRALALGADAAMRVALLELRDEFKEKCDFHDRAGNGERARGWADARHRVLMLLSELGDE